MTGERGNGEQSENGVEQLFQLADRFNPAIETAAGRSTPEKKLARPGTHRIAVLREHWAMVAGSCDANDGDAGDAK
jgi:hypothetical protein